MMYAVGTFRKIVGYDAGEKKFRTFDRGNAFSFSATRPFAISGWRPNTNGTVNSIAVGGTNCSDAYLGGLFSRVRGGSVSNLAEVNTSTGSLRKNFAGNANSEVETLRLTHGTLLTGGFFTAINGSPQKYYASLDPASGQVTGYLNLNISGSYQYTGVSPNRTRVYNQQLSPDGKLLLVEGDFTSVAGQPRQQIFMLSLGSSASLTGWTSPEFSQECWQKEPFYIKAASWSPDGNIIYIATTGFHPNGGKTGGPRSGLCDAAAAFPASQTSVSHQWVNYTGCDSLYATVAGPGAVYFAGHERWADNSQGCNKAGTGAVPARGIVGLSPSGSVVYTPGRSRGLGADDLLLTTSGLWIASDNLEKNDMCGQRTDYSGICFLHS